MTKTGKHQGEGSGWTFDSGMEKNINISKYKNLSTRKY